MIQLRPWKVTLVVLAFVFGLVFTLPNLLPMSVTSAVPAWAAQRLNLGLDLQGGSYLLLEVDTEALRAEQLTNLTEDVRRTLQGLNIGFTGLAPANGAVRVDVTNPAQVDAATTALRKLSQPLASGGGHDIGVGTSGQTITLTPSAEGERALASQAVDQSIEIIRRRIDQLGTREPTIIRQGLNRIVVEAPGESDPERLKSVIGQTAKLTFQMLDETTPPADAAQHVPPEDELLVSQNPAEAQGVLVRRARAGVRRRSGRCAPGLRRPDRSAGGVVPLQWPGDPGLRPGDGGQSRPAFRHRAGPQGDHRPGDPERHPGRQWPDQRQFHPGERGRAVAAAALRRPAGAVDHPGAALGRGRTRSRRRSLRSAGVESRRGADLCLHRPGLWAVWRVRRDCARGQRPVDRGPDVDHSGHADAAGHRRPDPDPGGGGGRQCADL